MMNDDFNEKIRRFSDVIINYKNYRTQLDKSLHGEVFDFSIILLWKLFMLFIYEKIQQVRYLLDEDIFEQKWKTIFKSEKFDLAKYDKKNLYAYNQLEDEEVINFLNVLYPIDSNFLKKLKSLKQDRHTAGHVCDPTLTNQENDIANFVREISVIFDKLQTEHEKGYLTQAPLQKFYEGEVDMSDADKEFLVSRVIESLPTIPNFNSAHAPLKFLEKNISAIINEKQKEILINSLKNGGVYNQIIESSYGPGFFRKFFKDGSLIIKDWNDFYIQSTINNQFKELDNYSWLKEKLQEKGIDTDIEINQKKKELLSLDF